MKHTRIVTKQSASEGCTLYQAVCPDGYRTFWYASRDRAIAAGARHELSTSKGKEAK